MPVLFLSHAGKDTQKALDLRDKLLSAPSAREAGLKVWLDVARGLTPGMPWKRQIENVIENEATSFAVMVGDVGVQNWVDAETDAALSRAATDPDFRFIPVLMDGSRSGNLSPFARRYHAVLDPLNKPDQLQALLAAVISKVETEIGLAVLTDEPFRGLASMDESWADRFFGRERETQGLIEQLRSNTVVAIVADSGTGKSSLAKAGVATAWRGGKFNPDSNDKPEPQSWNVVTFRPGKDPLGELKSAVRATAKKMNLSVHDQNSLYNAIDPKNADLSFENLHCGESSQESRTLLIIDQAEELFTQTTNVDKRKEFCRFLGALAQKGLETRRLRILLTIRADYANLLCGQEGLSDFLGQLDEGKNSYRLKAPDAEYLRMMVEKPLKMAGFTDELQITQLIEKIENDVPSGDGNLAMIQFALGETWKRGRVNKNLIAGYDSLKGVLGALGTTAEHYIHVQADPEWEKRIVPVFLRLIKLGESAQRVIRRTASMGEFSEKDQKLIAGFASSEGGRLLQVSEASVEISHESLITQWSRLHSVIERYPREIRVLNRITERCTEWIVSGRKRKFLTSLAEKDSFQELAAENASWLSNAEQLFLRKSKTNYKFSQFLKASIASVMLIALVASIGFFRQAKKAEYSAQQSQANALVYLGKSLLESDPVAAVKLLLSAWPRNEGDTFPATRQVIQSLSRSTLLQKTRVIIPDISIYSRVVFTPDNNSLIVLSREGVLRLWDADSGIVLREVNLGVGLMIDFDISRDGTKIVTVSENGVVQLWDATTGATLGDSMYGWEDEVMNVTFSPDSTLILIRSTGNEFLFWDIASSEELGEAFQGDEMTAFRIKLSGFDYKRSADGRENFELDERIMSAQDIAVSNDGTKFVTGSGIGAIQVWDTTSGLAIGGAMTVLGGGVSSVVFSPDGSRIASASFGGDIQIWNTASGASLEDATAGHEGFVSDLAFSPDGSRIVSSSRQDIELRKTLRIMDIVASNTALEIPLQEVEGEPYLSTFSPDGSLFASYTIPSGRSSNNTLQLWDAASGNALGEPLKDHESWLFSLAFSLDGTMLVGAYEDGTLQLWDVASGETKWQVTPSDEEVEYEPRASRVAFSPDGTRIVSILGDSRLLQLRYTANGDVLGEPIQGRDGLSSIAFSPDNTTIVGGSTNGDLILWDATSGIALGEPMLGQGGAVISIAFSPNGTRIVSGYDNETFQLWNASSRSTIGEPMYWGGHSSNSIAFSPDGTRIVNGSYSGDIWLRDAASGALLGEPMHGQGGAVLSIAISLDGTKIVSGSRDQTLRLWDVTFPLYNVFQIACRSLPFQNGERNLSSVGLADIIDISKLPQLEPCDTYDPPLPPGYR